MSYTPEDQLLAPSVEDMLDAIKRFHAAASARADAPDEWKPEHLAELRSLRKRLLDLEGDLRRMLGGTQ